MTHNRCPLDNCFPQVCIVLLAAYTAQLTTFLIVELNSISSIGNIDDLIRSGKPACALTHVSFVNT